MSESGHIEGRKSINDMDRDELIEMFKKVRSQTLQIATDKKIAVDKYETCAKEKEEIRVKALTIVQRCKELEDKLSEHDTLVSRFQNQSLLIEEHTRYINHLEIELRKYTSDVPTHEFSAASSSAAQTRNSLAMLHSENRVQELEANLEQVSHELAKYKAAMDKALPKLKELNLSLHQKTEEEAKAVEENVQLKVRMNVLEESLAMYESNGSILNGSLLNSTHHTADSSMNQTALNISAMGPDLNNSEVTALQAQLDALTAESEAFKETTKARMTKAVEKMKEMRGDLDARTQEWEIATARVTDLEGYLAAKEQERIAALDRCSDLQSQLAALQSAITSGATRNELEESEKVTQYALELESCKKQLEGAVAKCAELSHDSETKGAALVENTTLIQTLRQQAADLQVEARQYKDSLEQVTLQFAESSEFVEVQRVQLTSDISDLQSKLALNDADIATVREESAAKIEKAVSKVKELRAELETRTQKLAVSAQRVAELETQLSAAQAGSEGQTQELSGLIASLQEERYALQAEVAAQTQKAADLESQLSSAQNSSESQYEELTRLIALLQGEKVNLQTQLDEKTVALVESQASLENLQVHYNAMVAQLDAVQQSLTEATEATKQLAEFEAQVLNEQEQNVQLAAQNKDLSASLANMNEVKVAELQTAQDALNASQMQIENISAQVTELNQTIASFREESTEKTAKAIARNKELRAELESRSQELAVSAQRVAELETQLSAAQAGSEGQTQELSALIASLQEERNALQVEVAAQTQKTADLESQLSSAQSSSESQYEELTRLIALLQGEKVNLQAELTSVEEKLSQSCNKSHFERVVAELAASETALSQKTSELVTAAEELQQQRTVVSDLEQQLQTSKAEADELKERTAQQDQDLNQLRAAETELKEKVTELDATIAAAREESAAKISKAVGKVKELRAELENKTQELAVSAQRVAELETQLSAAQAGSEGQTQELSALIASLQEERNALQAEVAAQTQKTADLESQLSSAQSSSESQVQELSAAVAALQEERDELLTKVSAAQQQLSDLQIESSQHKEHFDRATVQIAEATEVAAGLTLQLQSANKSIGRLENLLEAERVAVADGIERLALLQREVAELTDSMASVREECVTKQSSLAEREGTIAQLTSDIAERDATIASIREESAEKTAKAVARNKELRAELESRALELVVSAQRVAELETQLSAAQAGSEGQTQELSGLIASLQEERNALLSEEAGLRASLNEANSSLVTTSEQLTALSTELTELKMQHAAESEETKSKFKERLSVAVGKIKDLTAQLETAQSERDAAKAEASASVEANDALTTKLTSAQSELERTAQANAELQSQIRSLSAELEASRVELSELLAKNAELSDEVTNTKAMIAEKDQEIASIREQSTDKTTKAVSRIKELRAELESRFQELAVSAQRVAELEAQLSAAQAGSEGQTQELSNLIANLQEERNALQAEVSAAQSDLANKGMEIGQLATQRQSLQDALDKEAKELRAICEENSDITAQLQESREKSEAMRGQFKERLSTALNKIKELQEQVAELQTQKEAQLSETVELTERTNGAQQALNVKDMELSELNKQLKIHVDALSAAQISASELQAALSATEASKDQLSEDVARLNEQIAERDTTIASIREQSAEKMTKAVSKVKELRAELEGRTQELAASAQRVAELETQLSAAQAGSEGQTQELSGLIASLQEERNTLQVELAEKAAAAAALSSTVKEFEVSLSEKQSELQTSAELVTALQSDLASTVAKEAALSEHNAELVAAHGAHIDKIIASLQSTESQLTAEREEMVHHTARLSHAHEAMASLQTQLNELNDTLSSLREEHSAKVADLESALTKQQETNAQLTSDIAEREGTIASIREESAEKTAKAIARNKELRAELESRAQELAVSAQRVAELETQLSAAQAGSEGQTHELSGLIASLQEERNTLQVNLQAMQEQSSLLRAAHDEAAAHLEQKTATVTSLEQELTANQQQVQALTESVATTKEQFREKFSGAIDKIKAIKTDLDAKTAECTALQQRITELEAQVAEAQTANNRHQECAVRNVAEFENKAEQWATEKIQLQQQCLDLDQMLQTKSQEIVAQSQKIAELETQLSAAQAGSEGQTQELSALIASLQEERYALQAEVAAKTQKTADLESQLSSAQSSSESQYEELTRLIALLQGEKVNLQAELDEKATAVKASESHIAELTLQLTSTEEKLVTVTADLEQRLQTSKAEADELKERTAQQDQELNQLRTTETELREKVTELDAAIAAAREESAAKISKAIGKVKELRAELENKTQELAVSAQRVAELETQLSAAEAGSEGQTQELSALIASLQEERYALQAEVVAQTQKTADLESQLSSAQNSEGQVQELSAAVAALKEERAALKNESNDLMVTVEQLRREIAECESQLVVAHSELGDKTAELLQLSEQHTQLLTDTDSLSNQLALARAENESAVLKVSELTAAVEAGKEEARSRLTVAVDKIKEAKADLESKTQELVVATERIAELEKLAVEAASGSDESSALSGQLTALQAELVESQSQLEASQRECAQIRMSLDISTNQCLEISQMSDGKSECISALETEVSELRADLEEANQSITAIREESKARSAKAIEKIKLLKSQVEQLTNELNYEKARYVDLQQSVEDAQQEVETRDTQLTSYSEHLNTLDLKNAELVAALQEKDDELLLLRASEAKARRLKELKEKVPSQFDVLMRCSDGERNWCLVSQARDPSIVESNEEKQDYHSNSGADSLSWHPEAEVHAWLARRDSEREANGDGESSFSIDEAHGDVDFPVVVQVALRQAFDVEKQALLSKLEELTAERDNSQQVFDKYRERARVSLMKTATELQASEQSAAEVKEQLREERAKTHQAECALKQSEAVHQQTVNKLTQAIQIEKNGVAELRNRIADLRRDVSAAVEMEQQRLESEMARAQETAAQTAEDSGEWQAKVDALVEQVIELQAKEKALAAEMKRKSELARQMVGAKDDEIQQLRMKLNNAIKAQSGPDGQPAKKDLSVVITPESQLQLSPVVLHKSGSGGELNLKDILPNSNGVRTRGSSAEVGQFEEILSAVEDHALAAARSQVSPLDMAVFNEQLYKRAVSREQELLEQIRHLKHEILRSKQSIMTPRNKHNAASTPRGSADDHNSSPRSPPTHHLGPLQGSGHHLETIYDVAEEDGAEDGEREQRLTYLKQAFVGFFKAKQGVEMQHLGRVICAILGLTEEEQHQVMEAISKLTPAVVATSTFESIQGNLFSIFS